MKATPTTKSRQSQAVKESWAKRKAKQAEREAALLHEINEQRARIRDLEADRTRVASLYDQQARAYQQQIGGTVKLRAALEEEKERCQFLEAECARQKDRADQLAAAPVWAQQGINEGFRDWDTLQAELKRRTRVAQQYFDVARNLGLKPGGEQAEPWLLRREE